MGSKYVYLSGVPQSSEAFEVSPTCNLEVVWAHQHLYAEVTGPVQTRKQETPKLGFIQTSYHRTDCLTHARPRVL